MKSKIYKVSTNYKNSTLLSEIEDKNGNIFNNNWHKTKSGNYKKINKNYVETYKTILCANCQKTFLISHTHYKEKIIKNKKFFCSNNCRTTELTKNNNILIHKNKIEFFYLLGLIATDGNLSSIDYRIKIKLNKKDKNILKNIQNIFNGFIKEDKNNIIWYINNFESYNYLNSIGITPVKSLTLNIDDWFNTLTYEQKCSFILGCIDGDGWILNKSIGFCSSSFEFFITIYNFLNEILRNYNINDNISIEIYKNETNLLCKQFYKNFKDYKIYNYSKCKNPHYRILFRNKKIAKIILNELYNILNKNSLFIERKYNNFLKYYKNEYCKTFTKKH